MIGRPIVAIIGSLFAFLILLSCSFRLDQAELLLGLPARKLRATSSKEIPGGTGLKHCDDDLDPDKDLFEMYRLLINPERPIVGRNLSITAMGRFRTGVTTNGTAFFFIDADHAGLVGWGQGDFCGNVQVSQTVDGLFGPTCPPVEGYALLRKVIYIDEIWPAGEWHVIFDVMNGTSGDPPRLFCIEGDIQVKPKRDEPRYPPMPLPTQQGMLGRSFWA